jgi:G3E family GTPase
MTPLVAIVGFLGSGKTTLLKTLLPLLRERGIRVHVVINDYQNAKVDAEQLLLLSDEIKAISGDCVCCGSKDELLDELRKFEHGPSSVILVETNGTTDSEQLIELLSLEADLSRFSLPIQVSLIDAKRWQKRFWHNALEREQARTASHLIVSRIDEVTSKRLAEVESSFSDAGIRGHQISAQEFAEELVATTAELAGISERSAVTETCSSCGGHHDDHSHDHSHEEEGHHHSAHHFSSVEVALPARVTRTGFGRFLKELPDTVIRAKGLVCFTEQPEEFFVFQKVDRFDEPQFFPIGKTPTQNKPLALFIGPELPEAQLRQAIAAL